MPITVYHGLMRSGKSYEVVAEVILAAIASGRRVVTNVDGISNDRIRDYVAKKKSIPVDQLGIVFHVSNEDVFKPDFFPYYDDVKHAHTDTIVQPGDLVCIDEAWRFWGATDCKLHKNHKSFFLEHGHFTHPVTGVACDLVLMIQDMNTLHRFVKHVVAFNFRTHKKVSFGLGNTYSVTMYEGYKQTSGARIGEWVRRYRKEIFPLYSSFKGGADGKTVNVDKRQNIFANPKLWAMVLLFTIGGVYSLRNIWRFFHPVDAEKPTKTVGAKVSGISSSASAGTSGTPQAMPKPILSSFSDTWRIAGAFAANGESFIVLTNGAGALRVESPSVFHNSGYAQIGEIDGDRVTEWSGPQSMARQNPPSNAAASSSPFGDAGSQSVGAVR